jgi:hypothetical protein
MSINQIAHKLSMQYKHIDLIYVDLITNELINKLIEKGYVVYMTYATDAPILVRQTATWKKKIYLEQGMVAALIIIQM